MLCSPIDLEFFDHGVAQRTFGQHAFDRFLKRATRVLGLHVTEIRSVNAARETRMAIVNFVEGFVACDTQLGCVDDDDEVARVDVRRVNGLVFAA